MSENSDYDDIIYYFYLLLVLIGIIIGLLGIIPSFYIEFRSILVFFYCNNLVPFFNHLFGDLARSFGYSAFLGDGNTIAAKLGITTSSLNSLTYIFSILLFIYCFICLIGVYYFGNKSKVGWYIIFIVSIPLICIIIGGIFLNYLLDDKTLSNYFSS